MWGRHMLSCVLVPIHRYPKVECADLLRLKDGRAMSLRCKLGTGLLVSHVC